MGNVACQKLYDNDLQAFAEDEILVAAGSLFRAHGRRRRLALEYQTKTERTHMSITNNEGQKNMIDMRDVTTLLITQAEDLLRQRGRHKSESNSIADQRRTSSERPESVDDDSTDGETYSNASSMSTNLATLPSDEREFGQPVRKPSRTGDSSALTTHVGNTDSVLKGRKQKNRQSVTQESHTKQEIHDDANAKMSIRTTEETRDYLEVNPGHSASRSLLFHENPVCGLFTCLEDTERLEYMQLIKVHASILYLQVPTLCAQYFRPNVARRISKSILMKRIARNVHNSSMLMTHQSFPELVNDSSGFSSAEPFFESVPSSRPVHMLVSGMPFLDIGVTGSLGLMHKKKKKWPKQSTGYQVKRLQRYVVLLNRRSGVPFAVCASRASSKAGSPNVRIYSTMRRVYGQSVAATTHELGLDWSASLPLYSWAEIVTKGSFPDRVSFALFMATGSEGLFEDAPSFKAIHDPDTPAEFKVSYWSLKKETYVGCAVLSLSCDADSTRENNDVFYRLAISRGTDPALMLCFTAIVDEIMEQQFDKVLEQYNV